MVGMKVMPSSSYGNNSSKATYNVVESNDVNNYMILVKRTINSTKNWCYC